MTLTEIIENRFSVRKYKPELPNRQLLSEVINAGRMAPSACNKQPWHFYVITAPATLEQIGKSYSRSWFATAPAVIAIVGLHSESWHRASDNKDHCDVDAAIAIDHMTLRATDLGLGTCWVCNFDTDIVRQTLGLPADQEPIALLPIGFPDVAEADIKPKQRKEMSEVATFIE